MSSVYVSPKAAEDLANIRDYIENELKSPKAAKEAVLKIIRTYEMLSSFPEMGSFLETDNASLLSFSSVEQVESGFMLKAIGCDELEMAMLEENKYDPELDG